MRKYCWLVILFVSKSLCYSQSITPNILSSSGNFIKSEKINLDYCLGEIATTLIYSQTHNLNQGFLQHFINLKVVEDRDSIVEVYQFVTPNNDGKNDFFYIKNIEKFPQNQLVIFNRYGAIVYRRDGYKNDWDANELADGSYFYQLKIEALQQTKSGGFTVLR